MPVTCMITKSISVPPSDPTITAGRAEHEDEQAAQREGLAERVAQEDRVAEQRR